MNSILPMMYTSAGAAALFGVLFAVAFHYTQNSLILMGITVAYALVVNQWVAKTIPKPPFAEQRKGSFKAKKGTGWKTFKWAATLVVLGLGVQMAAFLGVYVLVSYILG